MGLIPLGIDLAKTTFQLYASDRQRRKIFNKRVKRGKLYLEIAKLDKDSDFLIAMEACGGTHHITATSLVAASFIFYCLFYRFTRDDLTLSFEDQ